MRAKEELCDVYICCDGRRFPAHRVVLAATCPFFREKLAAEHDESECEESFVELEIPWNFDNLLMLNALDFLYEGKLILQLDHIKDLLQLLHYLKVIWTIFVSSYCHLFSVHMSLVTSRLRWLYSWPGRNKKNKQTNTGRFFDVRITLLWSVMITICNCFVTKA